LLTVEKFNPKGMIYFIVERTHNLNRNY